MIKQSKPTNAAMSGKKKRSIVLDVFATAPPPSGLKKNRHHSSTSFVPSRLRFPGKRNAPNDGDIDTETDTVENISNPYKRQNRDTKAIHHGQHTPRRHLWAGCYHWWPGGSYESRQCCEEGCGGCTEACETGCCCISCPAASTPSTTSTSADAAGSPCGYHNCDCDYACDYACYCDCACDNHDDDDDDYDCGCTYACTRPDSHFKIWEQAVDSEDFSDQGYGCDYDYACTRADSYHEIWE
jgi:hypothetical protein